MVWSKLGSTTLGSAGDTITVSGFTASKFNIFLTHVLNSGSADVTTRMDSNTGNNYCNRRSINGGTDELNTSRSNIINNGNNNDALVVQYITNIAGEEKLTLSHASDRGTAGAGNAPNREESIGKFTVTAGQFTSLTAFNSDSGDFDTSSNLSVLGSDGTTSMIIQDGAVYYDKTLNKEYILSNNTWTEL